MNKVIRSINSVKNNLGLQQLEGEYRPGYIYGNPKIHKNATDPPLRPIISQIGTPTYEVAKTINKIITPYMNKKYMVESTYDMVNIIKSIKANKLLTSLDVVNLFTNVPVKETIDIIIQEVYNHETLPPPQNLSKANLENLLSICTTKTPFKNIDGSIYYQVDGVSMGSPLAPVMANFYMSNLENKIIPQLQNKPTLYIRYVDDTLLLVDSFEHMENIKQTFNNSSVLKFTSEIEKSSQINFLDTTIQRRNGQYELSVYKKQSASDDYINFQSICPEQYKTGVIKTLIYRAYHIASSWQIFHNELENIKQALTNNNFPISLIDKIISKFLLNKLQDPKGDHKQKIVLYYRNFMTSTYKMEEKKLRKIVEKYVKPTNKEKTINLRIYYKNRKLKNILIKNNHQQPSEDNARVVYSFSCNEIGCNSSYIGYTTNKLRDRLLQHTYNGSIKDHFLMTHNKTINLQLLIDNTKVIERKPTKQELIINEALLIKDNKPAINVQSSNFSNVLRIF